MMLIHANQVCSFLRLRTYTMRILLPGLYRAFHVQQERALDYLSTCIDQVHTFGDILQLVIVELIYKVSCFCCYLCG